MYKLYNLALMIFLSVNAFCQNFHVSGKIMSGILVVGDATIFNARSKMQSLSNLKGEFQIDAIKGDSLIFTKSGFFTIFKVVNSEAFLTIALEGSVNSLKEVNIRSVRSSPLVNYQKNRSEYKSIYQKGDMSNMFIITPVGIGMNISALYSALSKEGIDARRLQRMITKTYENNQVDIRYNTAVIKNITGLTGADLERFADTYRPTVQWVSDVSDYEIQLYIKDKFIIWKSKNTSN